MSCLEISAVIGCKMNCAYCPQKIHSTEYIKRGRVLKLTLENYTTILNKLPLDVEVHFSGMAEPWMNEHATDMLLMAHDKGHRTVVYTTCYGMTLEDVERIKHIDFIHFCLHLPDEAGVMTFKVTDEYLEVLKACLKIPNRNFMCIGKVHPEVEKITGKVEDSTHTLVSRGGLLKTLTPKKGKLYCTSMPDKLDHNVLLPNGDVLICCMDYSQKHIIGNLLTMEYEELFTSEGYLRIKNGLVNESDIICRTCEISKEV